MCSGLQYVEELVDTPDDAARRNVTPGNDLTFGHPYRSRCATDARRPGAGEDGDGWSSGRLGGWCRVIADKVFTVTAP